jgi:hypothetical protein
MDRASLEVTTLVGCSNACSHCPQEQLIKNYPASPSTRMLRLEDFKTCLEKVPREVRIDFSGMAEPWLNPDCTSMVKYAHALGFSMSVYTTTVGMSMRDIDELEAIPFSHFVVHLAGARTRSKIPHDREMIEKLDRLQRSRIACLQFRSIGEPHPELVSGLRGPVTQTRVFWRAGNLPAARAAGLALKKDGFNPRRMQPGRLRCSRVEGVELNRNVLLPNGDVVLCCMDYSLEHRLGNLLDEPYDHLFQSEEYSRVRAGQQLESTILCRFCEAAELVTGDPDPLTNRVPPGDTA